MDPDATLDRLTNAITGESRDKQEASYACEDLRYWLAHGGYQPRWDRYPHATVYYRNFAKANGWPF